MKKIIITIIAIFSIGSMAIYAHPNDERTVGNAKIANLENLAQQGDTAAMHRLIEFYDEDSTVYVEVEEVIEPDNQLWQYKADSLDVQFYDFSNNF